MNPTQSSSIAATANNPPITMLVTFKTKPEMTNAFQKALLHDLVNARKELGCITMQLFVDKNDSSILFFFERWQNQSALDNHFAQTYTKAVLELAETALISPMEILYMEDLAPLSAEGIQGSSHEEDSVDLVVIFEVKAEGQERFKAQFLNSVKYSRPEPGCVSFHIHAVKEINSKFVLYERWRNQEAFDFHLAQSYTKELFESFSATLAKPVEECLIYLRDLTLSASK
ncbi:MAG: antibiotic biosynthesis monooxygenase [Anaerolineae bacterium]|nr:antibiotic biosynthesis monooxygenase [Gloeobacterales cyanobacterium ES-bin-313]